MCTITCSVDIEVDLGSACLAWSEFHSVTPTASIPLSTLRASGAVEGVEWSTTSCGKPATPWSTFPAVGGTHPTRSVSFHRVDATTTRVTAELDFSCDPAQGDRISHATLTDLRHFKRFAEHRSPGRVLTG